MYTLVSTRFECLGRIANIQLFVTVDGLFCYVVMPYSQRNALPTFVRAMNKTFGDLVRNIVEVYVDDIIVKTKEGSTLSNDLTLVFDRLRTTRTKMNPEKCVFGVSTRNLLSGSWSLNGPSKPTQPRSKQSRQ